jgi:regulator of sirC expression with transglutaminase-like and TPR domain
VSTEGARDAGELAVAFGAYAPGGSGGDELGVALLVNRVLDRSVDRDALRARADAIANDCPQGEEVWQYLGALGFGGDEQDYANLANSRMDAVLERRRGIPISLGVLLIHVARHTGEQARGINFPGHFLVAVGEHIIDPFRMRSLTDVERREHAQGDPERLQVATPTMIGMRMLNNVKYQFTAGAHWHRALEMIDYQLVMVPDEAQLHFERGELWLRAGSRDMARDAYRTAVRLALPGKLLDGARARLESLGAEPDVLH